MTNLLQTIFSTDMYASPVDKLKATFMYTMLGLAVMVTLAVTFSILSDADTNSMIYILVGFGIFTTSYFLVRYQQLEAASWLFISAVVLILITDNITDGSLDYLGMMINVIVLVMAGFLLGTRGIVLVIATTIIQLFGIPTIEGVPEADLAFRLPIVFINVSIGLVIYSYNEFANRSRQEGQDIESVERLKLADVTMQITHQASSRESLNTALNATLALILENYPQLYHAQVFLIDRDGIQAQLVASTGDIGRRLIANEHALAVGSMSVIGQTTLNGEPVIARSGDEDSIHRNNELLPDTQLEAAFPLRVGTEIIGALDLQSKVLDSLSENDRLTFQSLANSLSLAIDSIRQSEQAQARVEENQRLAEQTRTALREVERLNQRLLRRAWTDYARGASDDLGLATDFETDVTAPYLDWSDSLVEAVQRDALVENSNIIAVPLRVRGQVVGAVEFELDTEQKLTAEDIDLITEVSERFGLAAENTRLVEESQRTAQREALINQVTSRFQATQNVEATLAEAARSMSESLEAGKVMIRLGVPESSHNGKDS